MRLDRLILCLTGLLCFTGTAHPAGKSLDLSPARWIWHPSQRTLPNTFILFRKEIDVDQPVNRAKGWILADSRYQLFVNGRRVQWGPAPSDPRWQEADPVDLSQYLEQGKNVIACQVLFYGIGDGTNPIGLPGLIMKLDIDGKPVVTDSTWKSCLARCWEPGQFKRYYLRALQEEFDARLYPTGWNDLSFDENAEWLPAMEISDQASSSSISTGYNDYLFGISGNQQTELRRRSIPLMLEKEVPVKQLTESFWLNWRQPVENYFDMIVPDAYQAENMSPVPVYINQSITIEPRGSRAAVLTFEFEEQGVGFPQFTIDAPEGTVVELLVHEGHKPGNEVIFNSHFNSWTRFTCREGLNRFRNFDYESFRWLQLHIRNFERPVTVSNPGMLRRFFDFTHSPRIILSDPQLQRLIDANLNTLYNSCQDIAVDGMGRERQQYSGDGTHQLHPLYQVFGENRLPARVLTTFGQGITKDGYFLDCWPAYDRLARLFERQLDLTPWGPLLDHGVEFVFDNYEHYLYTGNKEELEETYPRLVRFYRYLRSQVDEEDGLIDIMNLGVPMVWLDHQAYDWSRQREKQLAFNLYASAMCKHALAKLCILFGDHELAGEAERFAAGLQQGCVKKYWDRDEKVFVDNLPWLDAGKKKRYSDRTLATVLLFHMCPGNQEARSLQLLKSPTPEVGISYPANTVWRFWALAENDEIEPVMDELYRKWCNMNSVIENNTIAENWTTEPNSHSQWSHCAVAPLVALYQGVAGAKPLTPGGFRYRLWPKSVDVALIDMDIHTMQGTIAYRMEGRKGKRILTISVPENQEVELWLDHREEVQLPLVGEEEDGISKYLLGGGSEVVLQLKQL